MPFRSSIARTIIARTIAGTLRFAQAASAACLLLALAGAAAEPACAQTPLGFGVLHTFSALDKNGHNTDGRVPYGGLTSGGDGFLYGVAYNGGAANNGTIFKVRLDGSGFQTLYSFSAASSTPPYGNADGTQPYGALLPGGDGFFYGTAEAGGTYGSGTIFKIKLDGSGFQAIYSFSALDSSNHNTDGEEPYNGLVNGGDGFFYGTTVYGGANGSGTVFQINNDGSVFNTLHSFTSATDGYRANGVIAPGDGFLYGATNNGGTNGNGTVFRLRADGTSFLVLHQFSATSSTTPYGNADGSEPTGGLTFGPGSFLYGTAEQGGTNGNGTVFKLQTNGSGFQAIHSFSALSTTAPYTNADGAYPLYSGVTAGPDGLIYGTAEAGGTNGSGTVFRMAPDGSGFQTFHSFSALASTSPYGNADGAAPQGTPIIGPDGFVYGTALNGGPAGSGTLYRLAPVHVHLLWDNTDGRATVWSIDLAGNVVYGPTYGPFSGWRATGISTGPDGLSHLLWVHSPDNQAALWNLAASGSYTSHSYGPYPGWSARAITTGSDNAGRMLWNDASNPFFGAAGNGPLALWNVASSGSFSYDLYGPFTGWYGQALASSFGGFTHILWDNANGAVSLWSVDSADNTVISPLYGPASGWQAISLAAGLSGGRDLLWTHSSDGQASLWNINPDGSYTNTQYGPYVGYSVAGVTAGPDGMAHLLWDGANGVEALWSVNSNGTFSSVQYGPYAGWSAVAVSAGP